MIHHATTARNEIDRIEEIGCDIEFMTLDALIDETSTHARLLYFLDIGTSIYAINSEKGQENRKNRLALMARITEIKSEIKKRIRA